MVKQIKISVAGSSQYAVQAVDALLNSNQREKSQVFTIASIITPAPKPVGRKQAITPNPLHQWAIDHDTPHVLVDKSLKYCQSEIERLLQPSVDILLVIDFGYLIRPWLLDLPKYGTVNVHPSRLPEWRGSSPGQCVLLSGTQSSAVTIMKLDEQLDHGPILDQIEFPVDPDWTAGDYYQHAFDLSNQRLPSVLTQLVDSTSRPHPQPDTSPTPLARLLTKSDGFIPFSSIQNLMQNNPAIISSLARHAGLDPASSTSLISNSTYHKQPKVQLKQNSLPSPLILSDLFLHFCTNRSLDPTQPNSLAHYLDQATRALAPWPGLWTIIPTKKGDLNMKILSCHWDATTNRLTLDQVHIAGQQPATWNQIKNQFQEIGEN